MLSHQPHPPIIHKIDLFYPNRLTTPMKPPKPDSEEDKQVPSSAAPPSQEDSGPQPSPLSPAPESPRPSSMQTGDAPPPPKYS